MQKHVDRIFCLLSNPPPQDIFFSHFFFVLDILLQTPSSFYLHSQNPSRLLLFIIETPPLFFFLFSFFFLSSSSSPSFQFWSFSALGATAHGGAEFRQALRHYLSWRFQHQRQYQEAFFFLRSSPPSSLRWFLHQTRPSSILFDSQGRSSGPWWRKPRFSVMDRSSDPSCLFNCSCNCFCFSIPDRCALLHSRAFLDWEMCFSVFVSFLFSWFLLDEFPFSFLKIFYVLLDYSCNVIKHNVLNILILWGLETQLE